MKDYYYLLGLKPTATLDEIKDAYRRLSKKFHPDVNDGDAFFAERFKDIQEAYETLTSSERRKIYDLKFSKRSESSSNSVSNFSPEIEFFTADKNGIHIGDEITFKWKTINADVVLLEPLGPVNPIGSITYRIKNVKVNKIKFKLVANNSNINRKIDKEILVSNLTYDEIYKEAYDDIKREIAEIKSPKKSETIFENKNQTNNIGDSEMELDVGFKIFILFLLTLFGFVLLWMGFSK